MSVFFLVDLGFLTVPASYFAVADDYSHLPLFCFFTGLLGLIHCTSPPVTGFYIEYSLG